MRVLYVSERSTPHDRRFLEVFARGGHTTRWLSLRSVPPGVEGDSCPDENLNWDSGQSLDDKIPAYDDAVRRFGPDWVYAGPVPTAAYLAARGRHRPYAAMSWGSDLLWDVERDAAARDRAREALRGAAFIQVDCTAVRHRAESLVGGRTLSFVQFPWGVDLDFFRPPLPVSSRGPLAVLSARAWDVIYGIETVVDGFSRFSVDHPAARLMLLNEGPLKDAINSRIAKERLTDRVELPGRMPERDLLSWFHRAGVYVSASRSDGSSITLLQAMACGLPAVVSDIPGNREWVTEGENGWLFPVGDAAALADRLGRVARASMDERKRMAMVSRRRVEERADWRTSARLLLNAIAADGGVR